MYPKGANAYETTDVMTTDPCKLILMLYDAALKHLFLAREGVRQKDPSKRGEHLGKVIAIVTELLGAVRGEADDEAAGFLRGLYSAILAELPKVNLSNDVRTVERAIKYMAQLRTIWIEQGMPRGAFRTEHDKEPGVPRGIAGHATARQAPVPYGPGMGMQAAGVHGFTCRG